VRGIDAAGRLGPDLTHLGGRLTLAAGTLPNNRGTLAAWITQAQALKPGTLMPSFDILDPEELNALVLYLESLK
jgi:cytochrome c oxidase subunit 2